MLGVGIDICEVSRFDRLKTNQAFLDRVFTQNEQNYCMPKKRSSESLAARFAAKEAFSKAVGTGISNGISLDEIEIINDELGRPSICLSGKTKETIEKNGIIKIHVTISHEKSLAVAVVIIE